MKFNCGESWEAKEKRLETWHIWFAWHPVRVAENDCRWLEKVMRRGRCFIYVGWVWKYKPLEDEQ